MYLFGCFNPRTHMGCDYLWLTNQDVSSRFNPRTHMGCDAKDRHLKYVHQMFQSTHPHGVRQGTYLETLDSLAFQSTHPHGVRPHIQQKAEYHIAKVYNLRRKTKRIILKEIKAKK